MERFQLLSYSASHICLVCYLLVFIRWRYSAVRTVATAVLSAGALIALEWMRYWYLSHGQAGNWIVIAQILVVQGTALYLTRYRDFRGLFTGLTSSNYVLFGNLIARMAYAGGEGILISTGMGMAVNLLFLAGLAYWLRPPYMEYQVVNSREWMGLCAIPAAFYLSLMFLLSCISGTDLKQNAATLSLLLTLYLAYVLVFRMINSINREERIQKERDMLKTSIKSLKRSIEDAYMAERHAAICHHDQRHMIRTMQTLMAKKDYEEVEKLLNQIQDAPEILVGSHYCDHVPINGVVVYYVEAAKRKQVNPHISLDIPEQLRVNEWELAVVIGNLMENAVRAVSEMEGSGLRTLCLNARQIRGQLLIEIMNTFEGEIEFDEETSLPKSSRGEGHGLGLSSVAYFAEHNQVAFDCGIEEDEFFVRLLI